MATILDGKALSAKILENLKNELSNSDKKPSLAVLLVGENPASELYVGFKEKAAAKIGIKSQVLRFPSDVEEKTVLDEIEKLNLDESIHAILVQLPLPKHINTQKIIEKISPKKDVDGFTPENVGRMVIGLKPYAYPCTPKGVMRLLEEYKIELDGKNVVVVGRSNIVGKPLAQMLLAKNATVTVCHSRTNNLSLYTKTADIVISAVGSNNLITKDLVRENVVVVDVGICKVCNKTCGDVDFESVEPLSSYISPVPGGVGPMTIAMLMSNTYDLFKLSLVQ